MAQMLVDDNSIYQEAMKCCKAKCIYDKNAKRYVINNVVWVNNMDSLREKRKNYSSEEKDRILRQALYHQLKSKTFETEQKHIPLDFIVQLEAEDQSIRPFTLCESCFVHFNQHKSKNDLNSSIILSHQSQKLTYNFLLIQLFVHFVRGKVR
jgi:hypothetical protein